MADRAYGDAEYRAAVAVLRAEYLPCAVKPFAAFKRNVRVAYTWEPVLWNRRAPRREGDPVGRDHLSCNITLKRGVVGAKPAPFAAWLRVLLGAQEGDTIIDLFPGSGAVTDELERPRLAL